MNFSILDVRADTEQVAEKVFFCYPELVSESLNCWFYEMLKRYWNKFSTRFSMTMCL